ncbi:MAG TPA: hypothetical protein PLO89_07785 [Spirochaetota bacterium]|nr:hypothetical protein [Spirochaetota bacterium]
MRVKNFLITLFLLIIVLLFAVIAVGVYYFDWFKTKKSSDYLVFVPNFSDWNEDENIYSSDRSSDVIVKKVIKNKNQNNFHKIYDKQNKNIEIRNNDTIKFDVKKSQEENLSEKLKDNKFSHSENKKEKVLVDLSSDMRFGKGSDLSIQNFHSLGELVNEEEYNYRLSLIKNLKIKTVVIDSITEGNGVTQEYYKIVFKTNMIPAKVMDNIINTKEFRNLIPEKYLKKETSILKLKKGEKIVFKNSDIKDILFQWCIGRLTPIEKAWRSNAL